MESTNKNRNKRVRFAAAFTALAILLTLFLGGCQHRQIDAITPVRNGKISAANSVVSTFCKNYTPGIADELRDYTDMYFPAGIDLEWNYNFAGSGGKSDDGSESGPLYALVYFADNKSLTDARTYVTAGTSVHVDDLLVNTDYYWQVMAVFDGSTVLSDVFKLHTEHEFRTFKISGVSNTRDLGGYSVGGGKVVRQGMIFRGANVDSVSSEGKRVMLEELGVRTDLDLRAPGEGKAGGEFSPLGKEVNYVNISAPLYGGIKEEEKQEALASEIRLFADESNYPVYFHCAIGRDRTGTLALLLLGLLGVPEDMIRRDYEMSFLSYSGSADKTPVIDMVKHQFDPTVEYLKTFDGRAFKDKVASFLKSIGITDEEISAIRSIMLR